MNSAVIDAGLSRRLMILGSVAACLAPEATSAQQPGRVYRLGFVVQPPRSNFATLFDELQRAGFVDGRNLDIDVRGFGVPAALLDEIAAAVVKSRPDAIYAGGTAAGRAVHRVTSTIPLIILADDMVGAHLTTSLSHPGGNVTGISILATELDGKRLELLVEMVPGISRVAVIWDPGTTAADQIERLTAVAGGRGLTLLEFRAMDAAGVTAAIDAAKTAGAQALDILASALFHANRGALIAHVSAIRLPAIYQWPEYGQEGGLLCYGPSITALYRQAARLIVRVLKGGNPAEIPIEQPTQIDLIVNRKTANELGLAIPTTLMARATEIIE